MQFIQSKRNRVPSSQSKFTTINSTFLRNLFLYLFTICSVGLHIVNAQTSEPKWKEIKKKDTWVLYSREKTDSKFVEYKLVGTVNATPNKASDAALKIMIDSAYLAKGVKRKILKDNGTSAITYTRVKMPFPLSDRDVVMKVETYQLPNGAMGVKWQNTTELAPVPNEKMVRISKAYGFWEFTSAANGTSTATCVMFTDPGGNVPAAIVNLMAGEALTDDLANIQKVIALKKSN